MSLTADGDGYRGVGRTVGVSRQKAREQGS